MMAKAHQRRKAKLVKALRSGKYPQTRGVLSRVLATGTGVPAGQCCLGVACDISGLGKWTVNNLDDPLKYEVDGDSDGSVLPERVKDWYGFEYVQARFEPSEATREQLKEVLGADHQLVKARPSIGLADLNDAGVPFSVIADVLERDFNEPSENNDEV
jgi:hypothetical protein